MRSEGSRPEAKESPLERPNRQMVLPPFRVVTSGAWRLARTRTAQQAAGFVGASLLANALAVVSTAILTRNLATADFGSYSFATSFLLFVAIFFEFGLFVPAARL